MDQHAHSDRRQQRTRFRWLLAVCDCLAWFLSFGVFVLVRSEGLTALSWGAVAAAALIGAASFAGVAAALRLYNGRHTVGSLDESILLVMIVALVSLSLTAVLALMSSRAVPLSLPLAGAGSATLLIVGARVAYRLRRERRSARQAQLRAVVIGAGEAGTQLVRNLLIDRASPYDPICFVDDDLGKRHYRVGMMRVEGTIGDLARIVRDRNIDRILIAAPSSGPSLVRRVTAIAADVGIKAKALPTLAELDGQQDVGFRDLRDLTLSDFLRRRPICTDLSAVRALVAGRRVLVTGAGGSIGSELCRQIAGFGPAQLFMLDRDESALHSLQLSLDNRGLLEDPGLILADIRDADRLVDVFEDCRPDVVFHAAALKHLTLLQRYPDEGLKTNVVGTENVLAAARKAGTRIFVNISTDKAADPTSVLGESKRLAERLTVTAAHQTGDRYLSVRFGNVLGSRGSVLTAFAEQIRNGGPLTVTHPDVTRFFMTVSEAVELVLQAATLGEPGNTLILDMGEPVRILDVAHQMIAVSGRDVDIVFTGLRPGEKLHEDMEGFGEVLLPTSHPLIARTTMPPLDNALLERLRVSTDGRLIISLADAHPAHGLPAQGSPDHAQRGTRADGTLPR